MNMRSLFALGFAALLCAATTLRAAQGASPGPVETLSANELIREMQRLDQEVWRLSLGCAGSDAVTPIQEQYSRLAAQLTERQLSERNPLDQAGDNCTSVTVIPSIPYTDTGTTVGYADDFATPCIPGGSASDVIYRFTPNFDMTVDVSLCGSSYNTVLTIWRNCPGSDEPILICCNDDSPDCAPQSCCSGVNFTRNFTYYIVVDGAPGQSGNYQLMMDLSVLPSCFVGLGCVVCPPGSAWENEICPAIYPDPNAGPACLGSGYETINCGETMCGKATHTTSWLDRDAYWITLHQRDSIRFCIVAEFASTITLYNYSPG